jgi:hypothetical protein
MVGAGHRRRIRPEVIAFIRFRPQLLSAFDRDANAFPSPRSWEFVSRILDSGPDPSVEHEMFAGTVGTGGGHGILRILADVPGAPRYRRHPVEPIW